MCHEQRRSFMHRVQMTNSEIQRSRRNDVRIQNAVRLKIGLRRKEMGSDEGRHSGWRMEQRSSKEEQPPCKLPSFTGNQTSRFNKIQWCTKRVENEAVQGDILINGKVLLFHICYSLRHDAMRKRRCFEETRYICTGIHVARYSRSNTQT